MFQVCVMSQIHNNLLYLEDVNVKSFSAVVSVIKVIRTPTRKEHQDVSDWSGELEPVCLIDPDVKCKP